MPSSPASAARRRALVGLAAAALACAALLPGLSVGRAATTGPLGFSTPTIVDPFREGFEPDLGIDPNTGALYSSVPNGTPGTSTLWRSDDHGHDWRLVEGNLQGEPSNCPAIAGGDTELAVDPVDGALYYADLQPLTNFNMSVSQDQGHTFECNPLSVPDSGVDRQWFAIDSDGGTHSVTNGGRMYFDYDDTTQSPTPPGGNVLVVNATTNGLQFGSVCTAQACAGPSTRITLNEGLPGNLAVDDSATSPHQHSVYALHSSADLGAVILTRCDGGGATTTTAADAQAYCLDPTAATAPFGISSHWTDHVVSNTDVNGAQTHIVSNNFTTLAVDTAGNLYALWAQYPGTTDASNPVSPVYKYTGPGQLLLSHSSDGGDTWSAPEQINPPTLKNNTQPWLTAGSAGRVAVAWYGAPQAQAPDGTWGPDALTNGVWDIYVAENLDALGSTPWTVVKATDHPAKLGGVSTEGLVLPTGPDRSLGDFMKIGHDSNGAIALTYVDDNTNLDESFQNLGPVAFIHQTSGPGLLAGRTVPQVNDTRNTGTVSDPTGDARLALAGNDTSGPPHLDITGSSVSLADATHLRVTLTTNDPNLQNDLGPDTALGGATADGWIVRWDFDPAAEPKDTTPGGFFVAMENSQSGGQSFFDGAIASDAGLQNPTLYTFSYPSDHAVTGAVDGNTVTWTVPVADVGSPKAGDTLYEVQGFTTTQALPTQDSSAGIITAGSVTAPNLIDQTPAYDAPLSVASSNGSQGSSHGGGAPVGRTLPNSSEPAPAGPVVGVAALATAILATMLGVGVRRRRMR